MEHATKKSLLKLAIFIAVIFLLTVNITGIKEITGINDNYYTYSNYSGSVTQQEDIFKGRVMTKEFAYNFWKNERFKRQRPNDTDTVLYRHFTINPLKFWRWAEYFTKWQYELPYIDWKEVRKRRGYDPGKSDGIREF